MARQLTERQRRALRKEAEDWDSLSDGDFERLFVEEQPVETHVRRPPPKTLAITLDDRTLNLLKRLARQKQIGPTHLAAMWIAERLATEA